MTAKNEHTLYRKAAETLVKNQPCVALTGAGVSAESGIPTFRKGGLWDKYDPSIYASIDYFLKDPTKYWSLRYELIKNYGNVKPNPAHINLARLEERGYLSGIITQNTDGLHTKAGSKNVVEIHGTFRICHCMQCNKQYVAPNIPDGMPPQCECGGVLKPDTVLFGEQLPMEAIQEAYALSSSCRCFLLIGTSAVVYPAASLPEIAQDHGAVIVEINIENSFPKADISITAKAGEALARIMKEIEDLET